MKDEELYTEDMPQEAAAEDDAQYEEDDNIVVLTDEDGTELEFELCDTVEYDGKEYAIMLPVDESSEEAVILEIQEADDGSEDTLFIAVDDEDILDRVFEIFRETAGDRYDFD